MTDNPASFAALGLTPEYKLSDAVTLFQQQVTTNYSLWAVFIVVTFAFAQFGGTQPPPFWVAVVITPGFLAFTISNIYLIRRSAIIQAALRDSIMEAIAKGKSDTIYSNILDTLAKSAINNMNASYVVHFVIDACAISALWYRVLMK